MVSEFQARFVQQENSDTCRAVLAASVGHLAIRYSGLFFSAKSGHVFGKSLRREKCITRSEKDFNLGDKPVPVPVLQSQLCSMSPRACVETDALVGVLRDFKEDYCHVTDTLRQD